MIKLKKTMSQKNMLGGPIWLRKKVHVLGVTISSTVSNPER